MACLESPSHFIDVVQMPGQDKVLSVVVFGTSSLLLGLGARWCFKRAKRARKAKVPTTAAEVDALVGSEEEAAIQGPISSPAPFPAALSNTAVVASSRRVTARSSDKTGIRIDRIAPDLRIAAVPPAVGVVHLPPGGRASRLPLTFRDDRSIWVRLNPLTQHEEEMILPNNTVVTAIGKLSRTGDRLVIGDVDGLIVTRETISDYARRKATLAWLLTAATALSLSLGVLFVVKDVSWTGDGDGAHAGYWLGTPENSQAPGMMIPRS